MGSLHLHCRQMLLDRIPPEAELQADLDVGTPLGVELLSTLEVVVRKASLAAGWLLGLAARGTDGGLCDTDFGSDLADSYTCASRRDLAHLSSRRYASRVRLWNHLARN